MNFIWLLRNVRDTWRHRIDLPSFVAHLLWRYSSKLPVWLFARENTIALRYPAPIGDLTLKVRSNRGSDAFIFGEVFNHQYYRLGLTRAPDTILDLGASAGYTAVYFQRTFPRAKIACVEPMPNNVRMLRMNLALNQVDAEIFPAAVSIANGSILMSIDAKDYGHKVAEPDTSSRSSVRNLSVPAITVPSICERLRWKRIGLLKVDIEGYEKVLFATDCSWLNSVDVMCIECHDGFGAEQLGFLATKYGFGAPRNLRGIWLLSRSM